MMEQMLIVGFISIVLLVALIPMLETGNGRYVRPFMLCWIVWELFWLGPPLFQIWVKGVLG